jgi:WD40 repeat protein
MKEEDVTEPVLIFEAHDNYVFQLHFTRDSQTLISCGMDNLVKLWSVPGWEHIRTFEGHENSVNAFDLSPDETFLVSGSTDNTVRLWSFPDGELLHTMMDRKKPVSAVQFSADGRLIAAASYSGRAVIWSLDGEQVVAIQASKKNLASVAFSPDSSLLATSGLGNEIWIWSLPEGEPVEALRGHDIAVGSLRFIDAGETLVSFGYEQTIKEWDTSIWQPVKTVRPKIPSARAVVLSHDEQKAAVSLEGRVDLYDTEDWKLEAQLPISTKAVNGVAYSPDGKWLAVGAADKKIRIFDLEAI